MVTIVPIALSWGCSNKNAGSEVIEMNMPIAIPRTYQPKYKGAPKEMAGYATPSEWKLLAAMTDGELDMTEHGVPSAYMEGTGGATGIGPNRDANTGSRTSSGNQGPGPQGSFGGYRSPSDGNRGYNGSSDNNGGNGNTGNGSGQPSGNQGTQSNDNPGRTNDPTDPNSARQTNETQRSNQVRDSFNQSIHDALTSNEKANFVTGADVNTPISRNAEMQVFKDLMDNTVGFERNPYTETPEALGKTAKALSGETIRGVGAAEVANAMANRARNPSLYNANEALHPRQFESLKLSDPKIAARMAADVPGTTNFDRALNNAINGLANPDTMNQRAIDATDFQAKALSEKNGYTGVNIGGNVFGQNYTPPENMSQFNNRDFRSGGQFAGFDGGSMPIAGSGTPTKTASLDSPVNNAPRTSPTSGGISMDEQKKLDALPSETWRREQEGTARPADGGAQVDDVAPGDSWFGNVGKAIGSGLTTANEKLTEANKAVEENGGAASVSAKGKLAQAFGFSLGADGKMSWSGGDNSKYDVGPGGQGNNMPMARSGSESSSRIKDKNGKSTTKEALLLELETTQDPARYSEIIQMLNTKYDPDTIRYGLQMRAA